MKMMRSTLKKTKNAKSSMWAFSANANYNNMAYEDNESKHIRLSEIFGNTVDFYS